MKCRSRWLRAPVPGMTRCIEGVCRNISSESAHHVTLRSNRAGPVSRQPHVDKLPDFLRDRISSSLTRRGKRYRFQNNGINGLEDRKPTPTIAWNQIPQDHRDAIIELALHKLELSPRE